MGFSHRFRAAGFVIGIIALAVVVSAATGTIQINVHPGGGTVCLDTACRENPSAPGEVGTVTFDTVEAGTYHMLNVYDTEGYEPFLGQVFLDPSGSSLTRDIRLKARPADETPTSTVQVFVTPDGGKVCLDRMCELSSGDRTGSWNVEFTDVTANTYHTITVSTDGYETYTTRIYPVPGKTTTLTIALRQLPPGSTTVATPAPPPTPTPAPTRAALPVVLPLLAVVICGLALCRR